MFTGSGDYHHLSQLLLNRLPTQQKFQLIICDNHPDNMRYPFGIHCGSWVYWASRLPQVEHVHVLGIGSQDIGLGHAWENHWSPLLKRKLTYWNVNVDTRWMNWIGAGRSNRAFGNADELMRAFLAQFDRSLPVYLSIDKDVLSPEVVNTNWDQGEFLEQHLNDLIDACQGRIIGADITGDVSAYHYEQVQTLVECLRWPGRTAAGAGADLATAAERAEWPAGGAYQSGVATIAFSWANTRSKCSSVSQWLLLIDSVRLANAWAWLMSPPGCSKGATAG